MTKPRLSTTRELFGIIGSFSGDSAAQASWNKFFLEKNIDAFMDRYPTTDKILPERLSEMFSFDRRGYIVAPGLQKAVMPLLDELDKTATDRGKVDTIVNKKGVMWGYRLEGDFEERAKLWELNVQ